MAIKVLYGAYTDKFTTENRRMISSGGRHYDTGIITLRQFSKVVFPCGSGQGVQHGREPADGFSGSGEQPPGDTALDLGCHA